MVRSLDGLKNHLLIQARGMLLDIKLRLSAMNYQTIDQ
ncbi:hypothetical protein SAMN05421827_11398 [Pedobacter terrae]|uniref:Uncharacterized protein n=1 Tax=Pedobacter terrae TaxID=405671 RepID=A0A1G7YE86_9SPHI|nr:hypothetical protein SAMN05421827_11398 [Pedobacter terrae]